MLAVVLGCCNLELEGQTAAFIAAFALFYSILVTVSLTINHEPPNPAMPATCSTA